MTRRTHGDVEREAIVAERAGALALARKRCLSIDAMIGRGQMNADDATEMKRTLNNFANDLAIGLHRDGEDPDGVRDAMRAVVRGV